MKSLGKHPVNLRSFADGVMQREWNERRVVYEKADGTFHISHLGGKKQIEKRGDAFHGEYHAMSIHSARAADIFATLGITRT